MAEDKKKPKVVKVKPYPIEILLEAAGVKLYAEIVKLAMHGCMLNTRKILIKVDDIFNVAFELPGLKRTILCTAKVIKTYDRASLQPGVIEHFVELHFVSLSSEQKHLINRFLTAIRQM